MNERAVKWHPVADIADGFGSISFSLAAANERHVSVVMQGSRNLLLNFQGVVALHYEDECPGNFQRPKDLPMLKERKTFPLLQIEHSNWLAQWPMHSARAHFFLISSDALVHLIARPAVNASWERT